jgi:hypothetical protein
MRSWCGSNLMPCLFYRDSCRFARSVQLPSGPEGPAVSVLDYSLGVYQRSPLRQFDVMRPLPDEPRSALRLGDANLQTRSALVVSLDSDGLLRSTPCRFVAPCNRPWGSPRFRRAPFPLSEDSGLGVCLPRCASPYEAFPSATARCASPRPMPSRRCSRLPVPDPLVLPRSSPSPFTAHSTSRLCSIAKSVADPPVLPLTACPMLPWAWSPAWSSMPGLA